MTDLYPEETTDYDDGTMAASRENLAEAVVGRKIVSAKRQKVTYKGDDWSDKYEYNRYGDSMFVLTLDDGARVIMREEGDCCAYTGIDNFLLEPNSVDHVITGVGTTDDYDTWHIYADMGDVMKLDVDWSGGNLGYYAFGFDIKVVRDDGDFQFEDAIPSVPLVQPTAVEEVNPRAFEAEAGSYFLTNEMIEVTPLSVFEEFGTKLQELQLRAGMDVTVDETSTGVMVAWKPTRAS